MSQEERQAYVQAVLSLYRRLPDTPARPRPADRHLARELFRRGVSLDVLEVAMRLAVGRRLARATDAYPLAPVRSLYYFLSVLDELPPGPPPEGYLEYLRRTVPDERTAEKTITPPDTPRRDRTPARIPTQLALPLDLGACPEKDVFS